MKNRHFVAPLTVVIATLSIAFFTTANAAEKKKGLVKKADESMSGQGYGAAGCGLGSMLFGSQSGLIQVIAATFNGTSGSQTFGISTGTSNCEPANSSASAAAFIESNRIALEKDVARGSGETLIHFTQVMGCKNPGLLGNKLQAKFADVFPTSASSEEIEQRVQMTIRADHELVANCSVQEAALANN